MPESLASRQEDVSSHLWYHTIELAPGLTTPGWFDLRPVVEQMPWPDVRGKRCLDVGTYDGFLAFELERRGASEVVAMDIDDDADWDWPPLVRATGAKNLAKLAGPEKGRGFRIAAAALGSNVQRLSLSVYALRDEPIGRFDVVVCGSLLLHLRDPLGALDAIRTTCDGVFLSAETLDLRLTMLHPRRPYARLDGTTELCQWWLPNAAGHRRMLEAGGFRIERAGRPYAIPFGEGHPARGRDARTRLSLLAQRAIGGPGVPHAAALACPVV